MQEIVQLSNVAFFFKDFGAKFLDFVYGKLQPVTTGFILLEVVLHCFPRNYKFYWHNFTILRIYNMCARADTRQGNCNRGHYLTHLKLWFGEKRPASQMLPHNNSDFLRCCLFFWIWKPRKKELTLPNVSSSVCCEKRSNVARDYVILWLLNEGCEFVKENNNIIRVFIKLIINFVK